MVCVSCGTKTGLPAGAADARTEVARPEDAGWPDASGSETDAPDAGVPDAGRSDAGRSDAGADTALVADVGSVVGDASTKDIADAGGVRPDVSLPLDVQSACIPLPVTWLPEPSFGVCPPSEAVEACAAGDVRAVVARSEECRRAWGDIPTACAMWQPFADDEEIVVLKLANCTDVVETLTASACSDHIDVSYVTRGTCQLCDQMRSDLRALILPRDSRRVIAVETHIEPPCLPSDLPDAATETDGAVDNTDGGCAQVPISESQAATVYAAHLGPSLDPSLTVAAEEKLVPGLWDEMRAQLFSGKVYLADGSTSSECSFIYRDCALMILTEDCSWFGPILSGAATKGAFYYSWSWGSGIYRSFLGKVAPDDDRLVKTSSVAYFNPSMGPPGLVVASEDGQVVVYRATVHWAKFNEWQNPELIGTLADDGDHLAIVDSDGQELPNVLP